MRSKIEHLYPTLMTVAEYAIYHKVTRISVERKIADKSILYVEVGKGKKIYIDPEANKAITFKRRKK